MLDLFLKGAIFAQKAVPGVGTAPATGGGAGGGGGADVVPPPGPGGFELWIILAMFLVMYFVMIRPQQKRQKEHTKFVDALKKGDSVITQSGIYGRIAEVQGAIVTLEIAKNTHIKILKSQLACLQHGEQDGGADKDRELVQSPR